MELSVWHERALFNPDVAPFRFAGELVSLFAGARHRPVFNLTLWRTQCQLNVSTVLARMADDARSRRWRIIFGDHQVRKFLIFIAQLSAFQLAMLRRTFYTLGKMAPV